MGKIFKLLKKSSNLDKKTPAQIMLKQLAKHLTYVAIVISGFLLNSNVYSKVIIPLIGYLRGMFYQDVILAGLSLAFATIPEELPILIKAILAVCSLFIPQT